MKLQCSVITIMFLCTMTHISSTSKDREVAGNKNTQNMKELLDLNQIQSQYKQDLQDQQNTFEKTVFSSTSKHHEVGEKKNTQNMEELLNVNQNQSQNEQNVQDQHDTFEKVSNLTSQYIGVSWHKGNKKWQATLMHNKQEHYGGYFDKEEQAAMKVNLLCEKYGKEHKNPMIIIKPDVIQQVPNPTSKYTGVCWHRDKKKWQSRLLHKKKSYYGGYFDNEEHAAMSVNLLCDKYEMTRKNPMINIKVDVTQQLLKNQTSIYNGVGWHKDAKKWQARLGHNKKSYLGGLFDDEEQAAMKVNLLCDKNGIKRKNPMIIIEPDEIQQVPNQTSKYTGVCWRKDSKKWQSRLLHKKKSYYGGYFDNEEHAAMSVNLLCDKYGKERKNPMIIIEPDKMQQVVNPTSKYTGVCWHKGNKKWQTQLKHNQKFYYGGYFDNEEHAAMNVNLLCDKYEMARKNPMINIKEDVIQQLLKNHTSIYTGVCWRKDAKKWQVRLVHNKTKCYGGYFDNEEQAGMKVNLLCDQNGIERKNPMIIIEPDAIQVNKEIKVEDENMLDGFKHECENRFMKSNDGESCGKRKRKEEPIMDDVVEEKVEITTPNHDDDELVEKIQIY